MIPGVRPGQGSAIGARIEEPKLRVVRLLEKPGLLEEMTRRVVATTRTAAAGVLDPVEAEGTVVLVAVRIKAVRPTVRPGVHRDVATIAVEAAPEMGAAETFEVL